MKKKFCAPKPLHTANFSAIIPKCRFKRTNRLFLFIEKPQANLREKTLSAPHSSMMTGAKLFVISAGRPGSEVTRQQRKAATWSGGKVCH